MTNNAMYMKEKNGSFCVNTTGIIAAMVPIHRFPIYYTCHIIHYMEAHWVLGREGDVEHPPGERGVPGVMTQEEFNTHRCLLNHLRIQIPYT
jgi:hypothetical protein